MKYCSHCGKKLVDLGKFCGKCGEKLPVPLKNKFESDREQKIEPTRQLKRFVNFFIDAICLFLFNFLLGFMLGFFGFARDQSSVTYRWKLYILGSIVQFLYYFIMEFKWSKTVAKFITKTKVVTENGETPKATNIFKRTLIRFVPFDAFSFLSSSPAGWHDRWSGTRVIDDKKSKKN